MSLCPTDWTMVATSWQRSSSPNKMVSCSMPSKPTRTTEVSDTHTPAICHKGQHLDTGVLDLRWILLLVMFSISWWIGMVCDICDTCYACYVCVYKGKFLSSTVSSLYDQSKGFILDITPWQIPTPTQLLWEAFSLAVITVQRLFVHISTPVYSQEVIYIYTAEWTKATWCEWNCLTVQCSNHCTPYIW